MSKSRSSLKKRDLETACEAAIRAIPPAWPLASSVAVNPFLGQTAESLAHVAVRLGRIAGTRVTMPRTWYAEKIASGHVTDDDLAGALAACPSASKPATLEALKRAAAAEGARVETIPTLMDLACDVSNLDWHGIFDDCFGVWAANYFDKGQALWTAPQPGSAYTAWRAFATHDLTPEVLGLSGFAQFVIDAPETTPAVIKRSCETLGLSADALETYMHQLLLGLGGFAQYARYQLWQAELEGGTDTTLIDLLAIRLLWEEALFLQYADKVDTFWRAARLNHSAPVEPTADALVDEILQEAVERAGQRALADEIATKGDGEAAERPALQAAFCIDVRSEVFRRALESVRPGIQTLGFAGFFGLKVAHKAFGSDTTELRLPVLLSPDLTSVSGTEQDAAKDLAARYLARAKRAWGRFKLAAVSSFAFVEATGPVYMAKLVKNSLALKKGETQPDPPPRLDPGLSLEDMTNAAETVLRAMSLTETFARVILVAGHGATVANNPFASGYQCGACGGYSGEVNTRLLATVLNIPEVRKGLVPRGINVPEDTLFLAALHNTTTDDVTIYAEDHPSASHVEDLRQIRKWLAGAGRLARGERALTLPRAMSAADIPERSRDWSEVRPEWGLAGCKAFIAAPRHRTSAADLGGRAFLHDYDWSKDEGFGILELIMTAPVVVASWISLQYYGSTVAPSVFGSGNKLLHNVVGGIGVVEGNGGMMRVGLPWQAIHDGEDYVHEPLRLSVCIEAPVDAMIDVLERHAGVRDLFDNKWLHLFALDDQGQMAWRYEGGLKWSDMNHAA